MINAKLTAKRFYYVMIALNCLMFIAVFAVAFLGNNLIKQEATKLTKAKTDNRVINEQQSSLIQAKKDVEKYKDLNEIMKSVVPQDKDQAKTIREISKIASETGVAIKDIKFQTSNLGQSITPAAGQTDPSKTALPTISQVKPIEGIKGVYVLQIDISSQDTQPISYTDFIKFLQRLENNRRTAHVNTINVKPLNSGTALTFLITLNAYVKP